MLKVISLSAAALIFAYPIVNGLLDGQVVAKSQISSQCAQAKAIAANRPDLVIDCQ